MYSHALLPVICMRLITTKKPYLLSCEDDEDLKKM